MFVRVCKSSMRQCISCRPFTALRNLISHFFYSVMRLTVFLALALCLPLRQLLFVGGCYAFARVLIVVMVVLTEFTLLHLCLARDN